MIIFYDKKSGDIVGTIDGRVHTDQQLKMWVGDKKAIGRLVVSWEIDGYEDQEIKDFTYEETGLIQDGEPTYIRKNVRKKIRNAIFRPKAKNKKQAEIIEQLEKSPSKIYDYLVDPDKKELILRNNS